MSKPAYINTRAEDEVGNAKLLGAAPFIYSMIVPLFLLHVWTQIYQQIAFRLYGMEPVDQRKFITDQRWKLQYLNFLEQINCLYCGYANGVIAFVKEVSIETEKMWCPIKDKRFPERELEHRQEFAVYGDEQSLKKITKR